MTRLFAAAWGVVALVGMSAPRLLKRSRESLRVVCLAEGTGPLAVSIILDTIGASSGDLYHWDA